MLIFLWTNNTLFLKVRWTKQNSIKLLTVCVCLTRHLSSETGLLNPIQIHSEYDKWQYEAPTTMDMQQHPPDVTCWVWQMTIWTSSNNGHTTTPIICHKHWVCPWTSGQETHPTLSATLTLSLQAGTSHCTNSGPLYRLFYNTFMGCRDSDAPGLFFTRVLRVGGGRGGLWEHTIA